MKDTAYSMRRCNIQNQMIEFVVPIKVTGELGLNRLYSTNKHWAKRRQEACAVHDAVKNALISQGVAKSIIKNPVLIDIAYNSRLDIDNHGYIAKLLIDGLKGYLLEDDNSKFVKKLIQSYYTGNGIKIKICELAGEVYEM